jgi:hypothetical protein
LGGGECYTLLDRRANEALSLTASNPIALKVLDEVKGFMDRKMAAIDEILMNGQWDDAPFETNSLLDDFKATLAKLPSGLVIVEQIMKLFNLELPSCIILSHDRH